MTAETEPRGSIDIAAVLDERTVVMVGLAPAALPAAAAVTAADGAAIARCAALTWRHDEPGSGLHRFVALVDVENIILLRAGPIAVVGDADGPSVPLPPLARLDLGTDRLLTWLSDHAPSMRMTVFDFLRNRLRDPAFGPRSPRVQAFLLQILARISTQDGFVEAVGRPDGGGLVIQGWSVHLGLGEHEFNLEAQGMAPLPALVAQFDRADLLANAHGVLAVVDDAGGLDPGSVRRLYFRSRDGYYHLDVLDNRVVLGAADSVKHVRGLLERLRAEPETLATLRRLCRVRFEGKETVSALPVPVRMAVDTSVLMARTGFFLTGWLLDPGRYVARVLLRSIAGFSARIDDTWHRIPRPDVSKGFSGDPLFAARLGANEHMHGYMVHVPREAPAAPGESFYLEIVWGEDDSAFVPLTMQEAMSDTRMRELLASIDANDPSIEAIIARHVGPMVVAACSLRPPPAPAPVVAEFGDRARRPAVSIVMPVLGARADLDVNLAPLALDPDLRQAELIVVGSRGSGEPIVAALPRYARFFGVNGGLLFSHEQLDYYRALEVGARAARADHVLFLSPAVLPKDKGWLSRLLADLATDPKGGAISPILLYEDYSIRFAGRDIQVGDGVGAARRPASRFAGYSREWVANAGVQVVGGITTECCLMPRRLFLSLGGATSDFVGPERRDDDLSLRLRGAGLHCLCSPSVEMFALDEPEDAGAAERWTRVAPLIDRWAFARKWGSGATASGANR